MNPKVESSLANSKTSSFNTNNQKTKEKSHSLSHYMYILDLKLKEKQISPILRFSSKDLKNNHNELEDQGSNTNIYISSSTAKA